MRRFDIFGTSERSPAWGTYPPGETPAGWPVRPSRGEPWGPLATVRDLAPGSIVTLDLPVWGRVTGKVHDATSTGAHLRVVLPDGRGDYFHADVSGRAAYCPTPSDVTWLLRARGVSPAGERIRGEGRDVVVDAGTWFALASIPGGV